MAERGESENEKSSALKLSFAASEYKSVRVGIHEENHYSPQSKHLLVESGAEMVEGG